MKLLFKQRFFSWFDSYDIYYENGAVAYTVEGQLSWGHELHIKDASGVHIATVKEKIFRFMPEFDFYIRGQFIGSQKKRFQFFEHSYYLDFNGWQATGNWMGWDYNIKDGNGAPIARISKQLWNWTDTYVIETVRDEVALLSLMFTLAIDAEKCSQNK